MSADRDVTGIVRSWLDEGVTALPDRVLDAVLDQVPATPQRRATLWPVRRYPTMSKFLGVAVAAVAIIAAVFIGYRLIGNSSVGPTPIETPTPTAEPTPSPTPLALLPPQGELAIGQHEMWLGGVHVTFDIQTGGWISNGDFGIGKGEEKTPTGAGFIFWSHSAADNVYSDPCYQGLMAPAPERTAAALAEAVTQIPGTDVVTAPTDVTVGGRPAKHVVIRVRHDIGCEPGQFYLWADLDTPGDARYATDYGFEVQTWIIEADDAGTLVWIDGETYEGAGPGPAQELQKVIDSIQFD